MANLNLVILPEFGITQNEFIAELNKTTLGLYDQKLIEVGVDLNSLTPFLTYDFSMFAVWHPSGDGSYAQIPPQDLSALQDQYPAQGGGNPETIDLRIIIKDTVSNKVIFDQNLAFNIPGISGNDPNAYVVVPIGSDSVYALFRKDGKAPAFDDLQQNVAEVIMLNDPGITTIAQAILQIENLNFDKCLFIARDLAWNQSLNIPPKPARSLKKLFDFDFLTASSDDDKDKWSDKRTGFLNDLKTYYDRPESQAQQLTQYIWALACAKWAENKSIGETDILFRFPTKLPDYGNHEINIINLPPGLVGIPAEYFYAHGATIPVEIGKEDRYEQIKTEAQGLLLNLFEKAAEQGIADLDEIEIPNHPITTLPPYYSYNQIIRLLRAQDTNRPGLPIIDVTANNDVINLISLWAKSPEETSPEFWDHLRINLLDGFTLAEHDSGREGHSDLVMFLFAQGNVELFNYLDGRFTNIEVAAGTNSLLDINDDDIENLKSEWETLYQNYLDDANTIIGDDGIQFLPPGTIPERVGYFAIYAANFFGNLAVAPSDFELDITVHTPPVFSTETGVIQQFITNLGSLDDLSNPVKTDPIIAALFPDDECGQEWLKEKAAILLGLYQITKDITVDCFTDEIQLSVWETLFSLGITEQAQIQSMSLEDFLACVKGTILDGPRDFTVVVTDQATGDVSTEIQICDIGLLIHGGAGVPVEPVENFFVPVNPGNLVNCIPPDYLSKTGRFAYLQDLLAFKVGGKKVSELLLETRRLSFDDLLVSKENAEIKIPRIDVVNGMLEGVLCNKDAVGQIWRAEEFKEKFCVLNALTGLDLQVYSNFLKSVLPINDLSVQIHQFWAQIASITDVKLQFEQFCSLLEASIQSGGIKGFSDVTRLLEDLANNPVAVALLALIQSMTAMDAAQFSGASTEVLEALGPLQTNPVTAFTTYVIQSVNQPVPKYKGIGNTEAQWLEAFMPDDHVSCEDEFPRAIAQSIPSGSILHGAACAYEQLAESAQNPCRLPFHQPLAVSKAYLSALGTSRFELARKFSQHIHGFAYDPGHIPADFKTHLFRYPVNHALSLEYLGISPQEYALFYENTPFPVGGDPLFHNLLGYDSKDDLKNYSNLGEFLKKNCLDCCELECWLHSGFVPLQIRDKDGEVIEFGCCDCDFFNYHLDVLEGATGPEALQWARLWHLTLLIRFARQLKKAGIQCYSCAEVAQIADKLNWITYDADGLNPTINPHFLEQFVAMDLLRSECGICFKIPSEATDPVYLTDLLEGPSGANWDVALKHFVEKIVAKCNETKTPDACRSPQFVKLVVEHINVLAKMAGFRSDSDDFYRWYYQFTNIIRFAQVLCRICDSAFTVGQLQFIFTADTKLAGDDPYPQQTLNEAQEYPFNLPDNSGDFDLESLREKLLGIELDQAEIDAWTWQRTEALLSADFAYSGTSFVDMGKYFFPQALGGLGHSVSNADIQFQEALATSDTAQLMWNTGNVTPFFYIPGFLTCKIPLKSADVIQKLQAIRQLNAKEEAAAQNLFFAPRLALAPFAAFFENFTDALSILIETEDETARLKYFLRNFALFYKKCEIITRHFTEHISDALGMPALDERVTWKILAHLYADGNPATQPWENDLGTSPTMRFPDKIQAGAFASLTRLSGTGLEGTFKNTTGEIIWREIRQEMTAYGVSENQNDSPVPTVIPNLNFAPQNAAVIAVIRNGYALTNGSPSKSLGGAQGYTEECKGVLYVTKSGKHTFRAGAPTGFGEIPDFDQAKHSQWQLTLQRGKTWIVLDNDWNAPDTPGDCSVEMNLKRGAYNFYFIFKQLQPLLHNLEDGCPQPTGWQIKWTTPYQPEWHTIPIANLYHKAPLGDLSEQVQHLHPTAIAFLKNQYGASISGMRRTAIRVFAGGLLLHGSHISAEPMSDSGISEMDYLLRNPMLFEGFSHYKDAGIWKTHLAGFDLNFIPVLDNYHAPDISTDQRSEPTVLRIQALFQWFEQLWEIKNLKDEAAGKGLQEVWMLWHECTENHPDIDGHLQKYLGVGFDKTHLVTQFYEGFNLSHSDLLNEEWTIRVWEIRKCIEGWMCQFSPYSFKDAKPSEWVNIDFDATGNENLVAFITEGYTQSAVPQLERLREINDRIRKESRLALTAYFESFNSGASLSLDDFLLMDSSVGLCDVASRMDVAIEMVQTFLNRINLGIEDLGGSDKILFTNKEEELWTSQYASYNAWKTCTMRACYPENFVIHDILKEDSKSPGFRFLKEKLKNDVLTMPVSGGISKLKGGKAPALNTLMPLQVNVPSTISLNPPVIGRPEASGMKNWESSDTVGQLNFWIETAENLHILRVPAAILPLAGIQYGCADASCCNSCSDSPFHPVTEYFFWLVESKYYEEIKQSYKDWENGNNIEELLYMKDQAVYFLGWSKIENGKAGAVQWSPTGIKTVTDPVELIFKGRFGDSLWIEANNGITALEPLLDSNGAPIAGTDIAPGFRFDLSTEQVMTLPEIGEILSAPGAVNSNPFYFLYHDPGAPRFPKTLDGTVSLIAKQLQSNCDFKGAKDWLDYVLNTLNRDNHWVNTQDIAGSKRKALLMTYVDNLLVWSKHLHQKNTQESLHQSKMILGLAGKILGDRPKEVSTCCPDPTTLENFVAVSPGINSRLLCVYDKYLSQSKFLEYCLNDQGKNCYSISDSALSPGCQIQECCNPGKDCVPDSPYRFLALINRAKEYANATAALGNALQSAREKGDQEKLTFLGQVQSNQLTHLNLDTKQNMVREAYYQVEALEKTLEITQTRLVHYTNLINVGLIAQEQDYISLTNQSMIVQAAAQALHAAAQFIVLFPEIFTTHADVGGGTKTSSSLQGGAYVAGAISGILQTRAGLKNYEGGNVRRADEWDFQKRTLTIEVEQVKNQLVAARLRLFNAQKDLDNYQIQIDHSNQTLKYIRDKFSNQEFYEWQEEQLSQLYYQAYECALQVAFQAERAYNIERCYSNEQFLNLPMWNNAYQGLMAGEYLTAALRNMDMKFMDTNHKWYELTKAISLFREMPRAFLMIKYHGTSLIQVREDLFAFDHPSHYCRKLKSASITIPCIVGPYENVNASMTLRNSFVRVSPKILPLKCSDKKYPDGYRMRANDDRFIFVPGGKDTLATSKSMQDSGYHQLSFQDERNLTFEHAGVEAEFCFSLKQSNNRFDTGTISDIILETSYIAKEGGALYGREASEAVKYRLPGNGEMLINIPNQFPDQWFDMNSGKGNRYSLELGRNDFPFLSFDADLFICQVELIVETAPCQECQIMEVVYEDDHCHDCDDVQIICQRSETLGGKVFHGVLVREFPVSDKRAFLGNFCFPKNMEIKNLYLLISYKAVPVTCMNDDHDCC